MRAHGLFGSPGFHLSFKQSQRPVSFIWSYIAGSAPSRAARTRPAQNTELTRTAVSGTSCAVVAKDMADKGVVERRRATKARSVWRAPRALGVAVRQVPSSLFLFPSRARVAPELSASLQFFFCSRTETGTPIPLTTNHGRRKLALQCSTRTALHHPCLPPRQACDLGAREAGKPGASGLDSLHSHACLHSRRELGFHFLLSVALIFSILKRLLAPNIRRPSTGAPSVSQYRLEPDPFDVSLSLRRHWHDS
jgi:hypothetical protein